MTNAETLLRCLGLSALIACAGCGNLTPTEKKARDAGSPYAILLDQNGCQWRMVLDYIDRVYPEVRADGSHICPASGTETRQGGDGLLAPSRSDDGPTPKGDAR